MTLLEQAIRAAGPLRDGRPQEGTDSIELGSFEFSDSNGMSGGCTAFRDDGGRHPDDMAVFSLDVDGLRIDDLERIFRVLRLGKAADRALAEALAYAAETEGTT